MVLAKHSYIRSCCTWRTLMIQEERSNLQQLVQDLQDDENGSLAFYDMGKVVGKGSFAEVWINLRRPI